MVQSVLCSETGKKAGLIIAAGAAALTLAACQTTAKPPVTGDVLSAAGFTKKVADTPARQAKLAGIPANKLQLRIVKGKQLYVYADPKNCICVYVGDEAAYQNFRSLSQTHSLSPDQTVVAEMNRENDWDFNSIGPGPNW